MIWASLSAQPVDRGDLDQGVIWTISDVTERKHTETVASMLYRISNAVSTTSDLDELYERIHFILSEHIDAKNFFIAQLDKSRRYLEFTYFEDEMDDCKGLVFDTHRTATTSLSVEVIRSCRPLLVTVKEHAEDHVIDAAELAAHDTIFQTRREFLAERGATEEAMAGTRAQVWLGVPLKIRGEVVGVMAVQSYTNPDQYSVKDVSLLVSVSEQIALAIERKSTDRDLLKAKELAEAANQSKNEFLANMSHEVRTPLNGVLGMLQLAQTTDLTEEQRDYVDTALMSGRSLLSIINDILDFSKIEAGKLEVAREPFSPRRLAQDVLATFRSEAKEKQLELLSEISDDLPEKVVGGKGRLKQILFNLVGNSIKFTEQGHVKISMSPVHLDKDSRVVKVLIGIEDTGIGVPKGMVDLIFEPFTQVDGSYVRRHQGTGLGLGIVKRLVGLMGGSLEIDTEEGKGTTVYLTFEFEYNPDYGADDICCDTVAATGSGFRLLVVEDNRVNRLLAAGMLSKLGHKADMARDGWEALEMLEKSKYDAVFMDIQMPGMDGIETTRLIRAPKVGSNIDPAVPVIAMTAHAMMGDRELFLESGMDDYIAKPVELSDIKSSLNRLLAKK